MRINCRSLLLLTALALFLSTGAHAQGPSTDSTSNAVDYGPVKRDMAVFQGVIDTTVRQALQGSLPILGSTRGVYLPEYGAVFSLEVNLYQIRQLSPFDMRPHTPKELDDAYAQMLKRLEALKTNLIRVMAEHGSALTPLKPQDHLTVVIHLLQLNLGAGKSIPAQVVLKVQRSILNDYRENRLSLDDFTKKVEMVQY